MFFLFRNVFVDMDDEFPDIANGKANINSVKEELEDYLKDIIRKKHKKSKAIYRHLNQVRIFS